MVGVPPLQLAAAERAAVSALADAQIALTWISCPRGVRSADCDRAIGPADLMIRLVHSTGLPDGPALAEAYVDTGAATGSLATVYVDRVHRLADASGVDVGTLIGRAIAHEVGHLLAGDSSHSARGLMRAHWTVVSLRARDDRAWVFSSSEAKRLRERLGDRLRIAGAEGAIVDPRPIGTRCQSAEPLCRSSVSRYAGEAQAASASAQMVSARSTSAGVISR